MAFLDKFKNFYARIIKDERTRVGMGYENLTRKSITPWAKAAEKFVLFYQNRGPNQSVDVSNASWNFDRLEYVDSEFHIFRYDSEHEIVVNFDRRSYPKFIKARRILDHALGFAPMAYKSFPELPSSIMEKFVKGLDLSTLKELTKISAFSFSAIRELCSKFVHSGKYPSDYILKNARFVRSMYVDPSTFLKVERVENQYSLMTAAREHKVSLSKLSTMEFDVHDYVKFLAVNSVEYEYFKSVMNSIRECCAEDLTPILTLAAKHGNVNAFSCLCEMMKLYITPTKKHHFMVTTLMHADSKILDASTPYFNLGESDLVASFGRYFINTCQTEHLEILLNNYPHSDVLKYYRDIYIGNISAEISSLICSHADGYDETRFAGMVKV